MNEGYMEEGFDILNINLKFKPTEFDFDIEWVHKEGFVAHSEQICLDFIKIRKLK